MPLQPDSTPQEEQVYFVALSFCLLVVLVLGVPLIVAYFGA